MQTLISHTRSIRVGAVPERSGSTLVEVLMAIMIMAIGVVSVATMFPLSMMRSIQATQLTSSTVLRYNAEAIIDSNKLMVFNPNDGIGADRDYSKPFNTDPTILEHYNTTYFIDPIGYYTIKGEKGESSENGKNTPDLFHCWLGNTGTKAFNRIRRFPGFRNNLDADGDGNVNDQDAIVRGRGITGLPDAWKMYQEAEGATFDGTSNPPTLTFPVTVDLTQLTLGSGNPPIRMTVFNGLGTRSQVRMLTAAAQVDSGNRQIQVTGGLPKSITPGTGASEPVGLVRFEYQEHRYTWALLVRRQPLGDASIDVVCFQKRPFASRDEQIYNREGAAQIADPDTKRPETLVFYQGSDVAYVQFPRDNRPWLQKNSYVLDVTNAHFYRIQGIREKEYSDNGTAMVEVMLQLDHKVSGNGKAALFMRGIVDVYPIAVKTPDGIDQE